MTNLEREMRILMSSSLDVTSAKLNDLGRYFYDPFSTAAETKVEGFFSVTSWSFLGGKEVLRIVHSDQLLYSPWYHRLSWHYNYLSSLGQNMGLDDVFALFYLVESPMFAVDIKFRELRRVQFGQIKVSTMTKPGELQMHIGGNNHNKEIWNQFDAETFFWAPCYETLEKVTADNGNDGSI